MEHDKCERKCIGKTELTLQVGLLQTSPHTLHQPGGSLPRKFPASLPSKPKVSLSSSGLLGARRSRQALTSCDWAATPPSPFHKICGGSEEMGRALVIMVPSLGHQGCRGPSGQVAAGGTEGRGDTGHGQAGAEGADPGGWAGLWWGSRGSWRGDPGRGVSSGVSYTPQLTPPQRRRWQHLDSSARLRSFMTC